MSGGILERIRAASAQVAARARSVRIDDRGIESVAREMAKSPPPAPHLDPAHHSLADDDARLAYVVTLDAINFGSGYFPYLAKRPGLSGYFTVATCLEERFQQKGAWTADELAALGDAELASLLAQDMGVPEVAELMDLFARALNELGRFLLEGYGGDFAGPVREAGGSAEKLVEILGRMSFYDDVSHYDGIEVPLYKRAQLTSADLAASFEGQGPGRFEDLDRLTLFADNLVPHVLRHEGALVYETALAERIDAEELLEAGSPEEVEIRACALHAVERIVEAMRSAGVDITAQRLDYALWNRGQLPAMKARPRHRARSHYY
jgi:hypothetical protein